MARAFLALLLVLGVLSCSARSQTISDHLNDLVANTTSQLQQLRDSAEVQWLVKENRSFKCDYLDMCDIAGSGVELIDSGHPGYAFGNETLDMSSVKKRGVVDSPKRFWRDVCSTGGMDPAFQDIDMKYRSQISYQFIGTQNEGVFRTFPGYNWGDEFCPDPNYDPRFRPWYSAAAAGPKDVVILMDTSATMGEDQRLSGAVDAVKALINSLSFYDYATVVFFSEEARAASSVLAQMTQQNRTSLTDQVESVFASGQPDYSVAFDKAFDVLEDSAKVGATSHCARVILFITDGATTGEDPRSLIRERNPEGSDQVPIFAYTLGDDASQVVANQIACENRGIHYHVDESKASLRSMVAELYKYFAARGDGVEARSKVKLSEIYSVAGTDLPDWRVSTAVLPVFDRSTTPESLIGVVGMDIPLAQLTKDSMFTQSQTDSELEKRARDSDQCPQLLLDEDTIELLRASYGQACDAGLALLILLASIGGALILAGMAYTFLRVRRARLKAKLEKEVVSEEEKKTKRKVFYGPIFTALLTTSNFIVHWLTVYELVLVQEPQIAIVAAGFLMLSVTLNVTLGQRALNKKQSYKLERWILRHSNAVTVVSLLAGINLDAMTLLDCNLKLPFCRRLNAPLSKRLKHKLTALGITSNIAEDLPFLAIQVVVSQLSRSASRGPIQQASVILSLVSVAVSLSKRTVIALFRNPASDAFHDFLIGTSGVDDEDLPAIAVAGDAAPAEIPKDVVVVPGEDGKMRIQIPPGMLPAGKAGEAPIVLVIQSPDPVAAPGAKAAATTRSSSLMPVPQKARASSTSSRKSKKSNK